MVSNLTIFLILLLYILRWGMYINPSSVLITGKVFFIKKGNFFKIFFLNYKIQQKICFLTLVPDK